MDFEGFWMYVGMVFGWFLMVFDGFGRILDGFVMDVA